MASRHTFPPVRPVLVPLFHSTDGGAVASKRSPDDKSSAWRSASDRERAGHRATVMRGAQGPAGRHTIDGYFVYSNFGAAFSASFVAPGRTILPLSCLSLPTGTAISCSPTPRNPPTPTIA
jgi:hypothetical protein